MANRVSAETHNPDSSVSHEEMSRRTVEVGSRRLAERRSRQPFPRSAAHRGDRAPLGG